MIKWLVSLDPGLRHAGVAVFKNEWLHQCTLISNPEVTVRGPPAWETMADEMTRYLSQFEFWPNCTFVGEMPQIYRNAYYNPDDILQLAACLATCSYQCKGPKYTYLPRQWKGKLVKEKHHKLIEYSMMRDEMELYEKLKAPATLKHNVMDAIGVGLYHLLRLRVKLPETSDKMSIHRRKDEI